MAPILAFLIYFFGGLGFSLAFAFLYLRVTPYAELALIREGKSAGAISLGGALVGFTLPLARAIEQSLAVADLFLWAGIALVVQILVFRVFHFFMPSLARQIAADNKASAVLLGFFSIVAGLLNAASMTE